MSLSASAGLDQLCASSRSGHEGVCPGAIRHPGTAFTIHWTTPERSHTKQFNILCKCFIHSFIHSFVCSVICLLIYSFIYLFDFITESRDIPRDNQLHFIILYQIIFHFVLHHLINHLIYQYVLFCFILYTVGYCIESYLIVLYIPHHFKT